MKNSVVSTRKTLDLYSNTFPYVFSPFIIKESEKHFVNSIYSVEIQNFKGP